MATTKKAVSPAGETIQLLVLSPEEDRLLNELIRILPRPPEPGYSKQEVLDLVVGRSEHEAFREAEWRRIYGVMLLTRRMSERRQPGVPLIVNTGRTNREPRYQLVGFTGTGGQPCIFRGAIQLEHARIRRLTDLRTRATSASELLAMKYLVEIVDALDAGENRKAKQLCRMMTQESLFIVPVLSLLGQLVGAPYEQARPLPEMVGGFEKAVRSRREYYAVLGKPVEHLGSAVTKQWPRVEKALAEVVSQLLPLALLTHGSENIRAELNRRAQAALEASLAEGIVTGDLEEE